MLKKAGLSDHQADGWIRETIAVLVDNEILETPEYFLTKFEVKLVQMPSRSRLRHA